MKKRVLVLFLCLILIFSCTGCGPEKLISLTDSERDQIVSFSAHLIGEFNRQMSEGYTSLSYGQLKAINDSMKNDNDNTPDPFIPDEPNDDDDDNNGGGGSGEDINVNGTTTLTDVVGIAGLTAKYVEYKVAEDYYERSVSVPAVDGKFYVIVRVDITNTTDKAIECNLINKTLDIYVSVNNGSKKYSAVATFATMDFVSYTETIGAGETAETLIFFLVDNIETEDVTSIKMFSKNGDSAKTIATN